MTIHCLCLGAMTHRPFVFCRCREGGLLRRRPAPAAAAVASSGREGEPAPRANRSLLLRLQYTRTLLHHLLIEPIGLSTHTLFYDREILKPEGLVVIDTFVDEADGVGVPHGCQPVRYDDCGAIA